MFASQNNMIESPSPCS